MKKTSKLVYLAIIILCFSLLGACNGKNKAPTAGNKPVIAVSIVPQETFVKAVCGDLVDTVVMVPPGFSPENYELSPVEMQSLANAAIYFSIGVAAEDTNILKSVPKTTEIISLNEKCAEIYSDIKIGDGRDPHIWLSPKRAIVMVQAIAEEMAKLDPENSSIFQANAKNYIAELEAVDKEIRTALEGVRTRKFIVFHPAFGYLADDYGLEMFALEDEGHEATAKHLVDMIDLARAEEIKVIFYQAEIDSSQSLAFAEEIGGKTAMLAPLSGNYIENLKIMAKTMAEAM